jgi:hypothetical protein
VLVEGGGLRVSQELVGSKTLGCIGFATIGGLGGGAERRFPPPQQEIK